MIQPLVKLHFVERYCPPADGWSVFVDIDPSEEGRTGSKRLSVEAQERQDRVRRNTPLARQGLELLGAKVGKRKPQWNAHFAGALPIVKGDRDIIAVHRARRLVWVAEVEGDSGGQPEGKVYKALGQLVVAASECRLQSLQLLLTLVVSGKELRRHLAKAGAASGLGISGLVIAEDLANDEWLFGRPEHLESPTPGEPG